MAWWSWIIVGTVLLGAELFAVDAQFYLIFIGAGAIVVGVVGMLGIDLPVWLQWLLFAALSVAAMLTVRRQLYTALRSRPPVKVDSDVHQLVRIPKSSSPANRCVSSTAAAAGPLSTSARTDPGRRGSEDRVRRRPHFARTSPSCHSEQL